MNKVERFIKKHLDESERELLIKYDRWLRMVFDHIPIGASEHQIHQYHLPQPAQLSLILYQHAKDMFLNGEAHGAEEARHILSKYGVKLADLPTLNISEDFTPEEAIAVLRKRSIVLAGEVESNLLSAIKGILLQFLVSGNRKAIEDSIASLLDHNKSRASLIVTTETTYAYNRGRLISYQDNNVDYVRFSAIMDARTSAICASRHGLVMAMTSPDLVSNTPPLHGRCRSVLTPIYSRYEPGLITDKNQNWNNVAPLPKGWNTTAS
ncbi:minor capsid protein [Paenibacillus alba]|uniref:Minor capsid protein n=1 Tax=Paenibacillus alba TaxID=1197127 RepID=A0ABU6GAY0_9BACL|nr:minor capsid protein [Paenibacillus alba]MEC0231296.1 minor capsid protein [Paenibacillus alba]